MSVDDLRKECQKPTDKRDSVSEHISLAELTSMFDAATSTEISIFMLYNKEKGCDKWIPRFLADKALAEVERLEKENKEEVEASKILNQLYMARGNKIKELQGQLEEREREIERLRGCKFSDRNYLAIKEQLELKEKQIKELQKGVRE